MPPYKDARSVENLSLFALIYLCAAVQWRLISWESFIIRLDILTGDVHCTSQQLRIFHYSPWYTYPDTLHSATNVENLSLFALIYLTPVTTASLNWLRIFHYSPWYTYVPVHKLGSSVENLSLFALIYLTCLANAAANRWESFIIRLDILTLTWPFAATALRIFHYSPWYTYQKSAGIADSVENLSLFALIYV